MVAPRGAQETRDLDLRIATTNGAMYADCVRLQPKGCGVCGPRVMRWRVCASHACERRYPRRRNRNSCYPHRTVRPRRLWRASSSHVRLLPREMRPKRYLPQESNHDCSPQCRFGRIFSLPSEIWSGMGGSSLSRRSLCGRTASLIPPAARGGEALGPVEPSRGQLVTPAEAVTSSKPIAPAGLGLDPLGGAWLFILATGRIENAWIAWVINEARPEGLRNGKASSVAISQGRALRPPVVPAPSARDPNRGCDLI